MLWFSLFDCLYMPAIRGPTCIHGGKRWKNFFSAAVLFVFSFDNGFCLCFGFESMCFWRWWWLFLWAFWSFRLLYMVFLWPTCIFEWFVRWLCLPWSCGYLVVMWKRGCVFRTSRFGVCAWWLMLILGMCLSGSQHRRLPWNAWVWHDVWHDVWWVVLSMEMMFDVCCEWTKV